MCNHENIVVAHNSLENDRPIKKNCVIRCRDCDEVLYQSQNGEIEKAYDYIDGNKSHFKTLINLTSDYLNEKFQIADGFESKIKI